MKEKEKKRNFATKKQVKLLNEQTEKKFICKNLIIRDGLLYRDYRCKLKDRSYVRDRKLLCMDCPRQLKLSF